MKVIAFNGSPRKGWNTEILLSKALEGAATQGAETELIHLYSLNYKGCISCFSCKRKDSKSYGKCAMKDDLMPILKKVEEADAIILGSPIYLGTTTGEMRSFLERLIFPYLVYDESHSTLFKRKIPTGFIYTMGLNMDGLKERGYDQHFKLTDMFLERIFGTSEYLSVTDTYQFDDYSKYVATAFDPQAKAKRREEEFPNDCKKAFDMGIRLTQQTI
ncbi:flavodoxin family protein [Desulfosporosinus sp.]|uniref:flavodoxin family protein n=1 Tax=Desulfosporosinus sp. TaxID=157907 RepID=UPI002317C6A5|nr:flavodoxin family protein [Desulfosporosinus sp.]MCO5386394.1 flavodoxin family protein [Desulfosporosinus sp.]MDA8223016.1 flavodoxin family protein [Desulfitobacterium hafniense]